MLVVTYPDTESPDLIPRYALTFIHNKDDRGRRVTVAKVFAIDPKTDEAREIAKASSGCSLSDNFNKAKGRRLALTRALQDFPKTIRRDIWRGYFEQCN